MRHPESIRGLAADAAASQVRTAVAEPRACSFAGHPWVFAGGLTNIEVEMTVVDTQTSEQKVYRNPQNTPFRPFQDTAFASCP